MKVFFSLLIMAFSSMASATEVGHCQTQAVLLAKGFLEKVLKGEWGQQTIIYVEEKVSINAYKVVINPSYHLQKHEDYVLDFISIYDENDRAATGSRFEVQMFANQMNAGDEFSCYTNSFRLVHLKEGVKF